MNKIGLLAGIGRLPVEFARAARGMGFTVIAIGLVEGIEPELKEAVQELHLISVGELEKIITALKNSEITIVTMLGKVTKELLFSGAVKLDNRAMSLLAGLPNNNDDTIMLAVVAELAKAGIKALDQTALLKLLMPQSGILTNRRPDAREQADMEISLEMARRIGALDIGQTVVVKDKAVLAVEAIEGTDACIRRGGELGRGGVTVAKAAKPQQDNRFDVPSVGLGTIQAMLDAGAKAIVMEAGKTLLIDGVKVIELANANNIMIVVK